MREIFTIIFCLFAGTSLLFSQTRTVTILNQTDNSPVSEAYVIFSDLNDSDAKTKKISLLSDEKGLAEVHFEGDVLVKITHIGFVDFTDTLKAGESKTLYLQPLDIPIEQVVVTAQYTPDDARNSVYPVKVISQQKIEQQGATNLKEVLQYESNIRIAQDNILGSSMSMQGLTGEQVKILIDGVPVIGRVNGNVDVSQLNLNNAKRVEIIEGPVSVQYGTNALGGVVNIITDYKKSEGFNTRLNGYYESAGVYSIDAGAGFGKNNHFIDLSGGRYFFDGYSEEDTSRYKEWKPKEQYFGTLKYGYGFRRMSFTAKGDAFYEKITNRGKPREPYNITAFDDIYYTQRYNGSVSVNGEILENHYLDQIVAYSYYSRIKNTFFKDLTTLEMTMTPNPGDQDTSRFDSWLIRGFISRNKPAKIFNYQLGYDFNIERGEGNRIDNGSQVIGDYAVFTSFNIKPVKELAMQVGVRWSYNTDYMPPVTPSFHIKWMPIDEFIVRASYARGFRAPSLKELYLDFVDVNHDIHGNPELDAENSNNVSLSFDYSRKMEKHQIRFVPSFFFNDINNMITLAQTGSENEYTYVNVEDYQTMGGKLNIEYRFGDLSLATTAGLIGRRSGSEEDLIFSPDVFAQASYTIPVAEITVSVFNKFNGRQNIFFLDEIGELSESKIEAYNLLDVSLSRKFWKDRISITAGVKNLLDVNNINTTGSAGIHGGYSNSAAVAWGRTFFTSLKFGFSNE